MTDRPTASTINDTQLDQLYADLHQARQRAADAYGQRDRLRLRVTALAERWQLPGHISMPHAAAEIAEALDREQWAPAPDLIARVRHLVEGAAATTAAGISDYDIGRHELAREVLAALDGPRPADAGTTHTELTAQEARDLVDELVTDPAWLCQQYAKAIAADDGYPWNTLPSDAQEGYLDNADAVMRVRDRHVAQLQQRLELAEYFHQDISSLRESAAVAMQRAEETEARLSHLQATSGGAGILLTRTADERDQLQAALARVRRAVHIADAEDRTDWQRGYRACANRVTAELDSSEQATVVGPGA
jgi:hypothetical protein